jgi:antitoxin component YwqK of YwqJK toxin-antitoxin module
VIRVTTSELDYPGDGVTYLNGERFTGFEVFHDDSGWKCAEHEYRDGRLSGVKRAWHRPGVLALEAECALGVRHGRSREWHESGVLASDAVYEHGIKVRGRAWAESGQLVEDFTLAESGPTFELLQAFRKAEAEYSAGSGGAEPGAAPDTGRA